MKNEISVNVKIYRNTSLIALFLGLSLVSYMLVVENEPGALPLFVILISAVVLIITQRKINKFNK